MAKNKRSRKAKITTKGMSKRMEKYLRRVESLPVIDGITEKAMLNIHEAFECYKTLLHRYLEVKDDPKALKRFLKMNRNPLFDITGSKYFNTGLMSKAALNCEKCERSKDHFIQRTKALRYILRDMVNDRHMSLEKFISLVKKYSSTVIITKDEHRRVTTYGRQNPEMTNVKIYKKLKIKIDGLGQWCKENYVTKVVEKSF